MRRIERNDVVVTAVLVALAIAGVAVDPSWDSALVIPFAALIVLRRVAPFWMAVGVAALLVPGYDRPADDTWLAPVAALLVATYSVAALEPGLGRAVIGGLAIGAAANGDLIAHGLSADDFWPFRFGFIAGAWTAGRVAYHRNRAAAEATERADILAVGQEARAAEAVAAERARLARELHDVIAHNVSVMVVQAGAAEAVLRDRPDDARAALGRIQATGRQTIGELRRLLGILRERDDGGSTVPQPSLAELDRLVETVRASGLDVELRVEGTPAPLPRSVEGSAYRIVQEALTNVMKHASASRATIDVRYAPAMVEIEVADDGRGGAPNGEGAGLLGMRERVHLLGGRLEHGPRPGGGFSVRASLPLERGPS